MPQTGTKSLVAVACAACANLLGHLKPRYSSRRVQRLFGIHEDTLRSWLRNGVPLLNGRRARLSFVPIGTRKTEFEVDEVERVYQMMKAAPFDPTVGDFDDETVLQFPDAVVERDREEVRRRRAS